MPTKVKVRQKSSIKRKKEKIMNPRRQGKLLAIYTFFTVQRPWNSLWGKRPEMLSWADGIMHFLGKIHDFLTAQRSFDGFRKITKKRHSIHKSTTREQHIEIG
jgi:hypothetical protein